MPRKKTTGKTTGKMRSMTGFGRGTAKAGGVSASVEIRSVNQRFLRVGVKLPPDLAAFEPRVRELVSGAVSRGHIDAFVTLDGGAAAGVPIPDPERVRRYVEAWRAVARKLKLPGRLEVGTLAAMPHVFASGEGGGEAERAWPAVEKAVGKALRLLDRMRATEGRRLARDLLARIAGIEEATQRIKRRSKASKAGYAGKLRARVEELAKGLLSECDLPAGSLDRDSLEREIVLGSCLQADRRDVSEELERIGSHVEQFRSTLSGGSPAGRKLEFLVQELQREITTLGSKVADVEAGFEVVEFKAELETIREQVQNIE